MNTKRIANVFAVVRRCGLASSIAVAMVASAGAAFAENVKVVADIACAEDWGKYCSNKGYQGPESAGKCLKINLAKLSAVCVAAMHEKPVSAETACAKEIGKYCTDKKYQQVGGLRTCLDTKRAKLSAVCNIVLDATGGR